MIEVTTAITPDGPLEIVDALFSYDFCSRHPYVRLSEAPVDGEPLGEYVRVLLHSEFSPPDVYFGPYEAGLPFEPLGTIDVLEPFDRWTTNDPDAMAWLHASIDVQADGWDLVVEVGAPFCADWIDCFCPCE
jgi:hypothetical protein